MEQIDLNIDNYNLQDLCDLFRINITQITQDAMRDAKKIVLKMHPDKSKLEPKYFLFFSSAYKKLYSVYEFQNKSSNKKLDVNNYEYKEENTHILNKLFEKNKALKKPENFNKWFNEQFDKHKIQNDNDAGYGEWLKTDEGLYDTVSVSQANMNEEFEKQKKQIQTISVYKGISDPFASSLGGALLGKNGDYSSGLFEQGGLQYQDLKQAHIETIIPISNDDYSKIPKFHSEQEYKMYRDRQDIKPINENVALNRLRKNTEHLEEESANVAFYYAQQLEEANKQQNKFWSRLNHLTN
jgi:hypothetical protein